MSPFLSLDNFHTTFSNGLHRLLEHGLGAYILVLANASFRRENFLALYPALERGFETQCQALATTSHTHLPADDVAVFEQLQTLGLAQVETVKFRHPGPWEIQYNPLRAMRPPRNAHAVVKQLFQPFDNHAFHFNKPFLRKESIWDGILNGHQLDVLYNKFPFVDLHGLLIPERKKQWPQYLNAEMHRYIWQLCTELPLPGLGFGYNALGAYSSVNHLHFQSFLREQALPVESQQWLHNGGNKPYPSECQVFDKLESAYRYINTLHEANCCYNLLYRPGRLYCLPRRFQGSYQHAPWTGGFAWYEMCGGMTVFAQQQFEDLTEADIISEFHKLNLNSIYVYN
ncbi:hypothetical protein QUF61_08540 [Candidatus Venteria ishoeyi]|uniref:hypothetical protein n=1 Tax=Candidatus Venteria ishoeyi TaxID=1899563 RepID=UPI0025A67CCB|nr:hypothetical protein [Candidatus Venteria ishoeyi]MDM8546530.1 hypothetical protein [Candidatus Venteria ishoeyi]